MGDYRCFQNRECAYFPCHKGVKEQNFNCLFCYCPLYALGDRCGGNFTYTNNGIKDCSQCTIPHKQGNYEVMIQRMQDVIEMAKKKER